MSMVALFLLGGDITANAMAHGLLKKGMSGKKRSFEASSLGGRDLWGLLCIVLGLGAYGLSFVFYAALLSMVDLSFAYPVCTGGAFVLVLLCSAFFFRERLHFWRLLGISIIFLGIMVMAVDM